LMIPDLVKLKQCLLMQNIKSSDFTALSVNSFSSVQPSDKLLDLSGKYGFINIVIRYPLLILI